MPLDILLAAEGGHATHDWWMDPHGVGLVFWTGLAFGVVLLILYKKAWGPLLVALDAREQGIAGQVAEANRLKADAERLRLQYEAKLEDARREATAIIAEGEADKKRIQEEARQVAESEAKAIKERAARDVTLARDKALAELQQGSVKLGLQIAEKVIGAEVDAHRHRALIDGVVASYAKR
jgi:F-type H+-transporting ATPase subunit b